MAKVLGKGAFVMPMSVLWEADPMGMIIEIIGSLPAVFISTFGLTFHLFRFLDKFVEQRQNKRPKGLLLIFCVVDSIYTTFVITLYSGGTPVLYLLLFLNIFHMLEHAYMSSDKIEPYLFLSSGAFLNYLMGYLVLFSLYRILPVDFFDVASELYQRTIFVLINITCIVLLLGLMRSAFPVKEIKEVIHSSENRLLNVLLPASNIMMFLFGVGVLPMVHTRLTDRMIEIGLYTSVLCWAANSMMTWWVIVMYQAYRVRIRNSMQNELGKEREHKAELKELADRQPLTGLFNRRAWEREVKEMLTAGKNGYLVMLDLDHFKEVNDNLGHPEGDRILKETADMLRETFRKIDIIGHIGGDEFCVFLVGDFEKEIVDRRLEHFMSLRRKEFPSKSGGTFCLSVSAGYAGVPNQGEPLDKFVELVARADAALYWQKEHGRNGFARWNEEMEKS